ncbi:MAG: hypothetical protein MUC43_13905 [Pirellula sp.]|nr:hypothetical protein [Pirellula sp.]
MKRIFHSCWRCFPLEQTSRMGSTNSLAWVRSNGYEWISEACVTVSKSSHKIPARHVSNAMSATCFFDSFEMPNCLRIQGFSNPLRNLKHTTAPKTTGSQEREIDSPIATL